MSPTAQKQPAVLITGCTGYVGRQLATRLAGVGYRVTGTSRRDFRLAGVRAERGLLTDEAFLMDVLADQDVLIHAAALTRSNDARELYESNEKVTSCLLDAAARREVKRIIYLSSDQAVHEVGPYGASKRRCEILVQQKATDYAILRMTPVIGEYCPGANSTYSKLVDRLSRGRPFLLPGNGRFPIAPVSIEDVATVIDLLIRKRAPLTKVYGLCGQHSSFVRFVDTVEKRLGSRTARIQLPLPLLKAGAQLCRMTPLASRLPVDSILSIGAPVPVSARELMDDLGFRPTPLAKVIAEMEGFPSRHGL